MESATIPDAGEARSLWNTDVAFVPSVSAVIVTDVVVEGVDEDEEHPFDPNTLIAKIKAEPIVVIIFIDFFEIEVSARSILLINSVGMRL
jgi:hypothetical protein